MELFNSLDIVTILYLISIEFMYQNIQYIFGQKLRHLFFIDFLELLDYHRLLNYCNKGFYQGHDKFLVLILAYDLLILPTIFLLLAFGSLILANMKSSYCLLLLLIVGFLKLNK